MASNGLDPDQLTGFRQQLRDRPAAAQAVVAIRQHWRHGYHVRSHATELRSAGQTLARDHTLVSDLPQPFGGGDEGPVPGELLLSALAACVSGQFVEHATLEGVEVARLEVACEGEIDLRGSLGVSGVRPGLQRVVIVGTAEADASPERVDELWARAVRTSPVADSLRGRVELEPSVHLRTADAASSGR